MGACLTTAAPGRATKPAPDQTIGVISTEEEVKVKKDKGWRGHGQRERERK
jgi:hypothetical protein